MDQNFHTRIRQMARNIEDFALLYRAKNAQNPGKYPLDISNERIEFYWAEAARFSIDDIPIIAKDVRANCNRFFVDVNGVIFTVYPSGDTNFPGDIKIEEATADRLFAQVSILGEYEDGDESGGRLIEDEYVLWDSLMELGAACL